jgi:hypothetical protein
MQRETRRVRVGREIPSQVWAVVLSGLVGIAMATPAAARDLTEPVDSYATVTALREVPAGSPLPGLHLDAKVKGQPVDIYIAPLDFAHRYGVKVAKGDYVHIVGTEVKSGESDVVLTREIDTGLYDNKTGAFRVTLSVYLRNDNGPFWDDK